MYLDKDDQCKVLIGDNFECIMKGIRIVKLSLNDGLDFFLRLKRVIFVGMLDSSGYSIKIESGE